MSFGFGKNSGPTAPPSGPTPFGYFPRPPSPTPTPTPSPSPFPVSDFPAAPRFLSPRTFDVHGQIRSPSFLSNAHLETSPSQPYDGPIRGDVQNPVTEDFGSQSQKRPFPSASQDFGSSIPSKIPHFQNSGRSRSSPIQYNEEFLQNPGGAIMERAFNAHGRAKSPSFLDNARLGTSSSQSYAAPIRGDKQNPVNGDIGSQSQKRPFPSASQGLGASMSSKIQHFQNPERSRSPPIQYNEDFLQDRGGAIMEGNADMASGLHDYTQRRQSPSSAAAVSHSIINPRLSWSKSQRPATNSHTWVAPGKSGSRNTSPQNEKTISPTKTVGSWKSKELSSEDDFQRNSYAHGDAFKRPSSSPPNSRSETSGVRMPDVHINQRLSSSTDGMNGDTYMSKLASHSVSKRTRSPTSAVGPIVQMNSSTTEDDIAREEQAKAKRLARFKVEPVEGERGDSIQYGQNVTEGRVSLVKSGRMAVEKQKFPGDITPGSMESQDLDNEDLQSSSAIVGLCIDMCPVSERGERERKGDLDQYERLDGDRNQTSKTLAVKKYNRTAEREAELIRPLPILQKTMDYLLGLLDQPYDDRFLRLYNFLWDRMRAIRMDLRMQHIFNDRAISMLEQMIRLHIIAMHELCEFSRGEGFTEGFDSHLNIEQMNKTSVELFQIYDDHRKRGIFIPTEKEFRGYYALLKLDKHPGYKVEPAELSLDLAKMTAEIRQTLEVLFARDVARSCRTSNFIAFFRHARKASYLQACLMHAHFSKLRTQALASLHSGLQYNQGIPVAHVAKWIGMEGEDIESLLEYHGFLIKEFEEPYMVKEGPFLNDEKDYPTRCSALVHSKKSDTIMEDVLSSHQVILLPSKPRQELQSHKNSKNKQAAMQPIQTKSPVVSHSLMDFEAISSPMRSMQDQPVLETSRSMKVQADLGTSRDSQPFTDDHHSDATGFPKDNINAFASFQSHSKVDQPSPVLPNHGFLNVGAGQLSSRDSPLSFSAQQYFPPAKSPSFGLARQDNFEGFVKKPLEIVAHSDIKSLQPELVSANVEVIVPASEADSSDVSALEDVSVKDKLREEVPVQKEVDDDVSDNYDEEVAEAKLRLLLRLWRRRYVRKKYLHEQNRLAANAALSSLSLGPPIWRNQDKPTPYRKLSIDQAMNERSEKHQLSLARWNVSDVVASKLAEINENSNCICWKLITFSWSQDARSDMEARSPVSHLSLDDWLRYKLIPASKEEAVEDLVISAPRLSVWRKWASDKFGDLRCYFSVIEDTQPGESRLVGANAIMFSLSETLSWDIQRAQLNNLVTSLPAGACIPLLIIGGSGQGNFAEFSCSIVDNLGLKDLDKLRIGSYMVICLNEGGDGQFHGYFSDQKLKEGLMWLASKSCSQPVLICVKMRELISRHLNSHLDALGFIRDEVGPYHCISAFNQALEQSTNDIITAANTNPTGWPCPELHLLDNSTAEFKVVKQFLPSSRWSSSEEVEPLISALRNCKLPSFSDDISWLSRGCRSEQDIENIKQLLEDCLIRYLIESSSMLNIPMATKEARMMVQKYSRLELHDQEYKVVPNWVLIFRRVFNWQLNTSASFSCKAYVLEQSLTTCSPLDFSKLEVELPKPRYIAHPSLDEMVEVSCSPIVSKRVRSSPKSFQKVAAMSSGKNASGVIAPNFLVEKRSHFSEIDVVEDIHSRKNDGTLVREDEKEADRLRQLLNQCNILQDENEKKLSLYF
ncbi:SAC3 family protein B isoform X2 [Beta vulgaris subsp. vulgaris]|uniref:SAC3 family protein B isoform X2 n=1 Tax=Beta vulgaris subsp. vulgaris TaxID=3555 RepID=UPI002036F2BB|nr:SAC3 family protein B isoform X2 [Beta vulgaris subsp. vulgaris]